MHLPPSVPTHRLSRQMVWCLHRVSYLSTLQQEPSHLAHVVKTTVFLSDMDNFAAMNEVYAEFFSQPFPARSAVAVKTLPKNALVEVECIAVK